MQFTHTEIAQLVGEQTLTIYAQGKQIAELQAEVIRLTPKTDNVQPIRDAG
jgi:hypothetical protein